ncbi:MAG: ATP-binding protein [Gammaproteobacteria bacterium]|nr:ATP-binding protein [Gammaproteobacteria bacterium]
MKKVLLRFAVENHRSIPERQEISFVASRLRDQDDSLIPCDAVKSCAVVPVAMIYGANASGKTNMINAMETMRWLVLWSHIIGSRSGKVPRQAFALDTDYSKKPSIFEIDFVLEGVSYYYGFEAMDRSFTSEWLYERPRNHSKKLFERYEQQFDFGRSFKGQKHSIAELARPNSLFLSVAAQNNHGLLTRIHEYFENLVFTGTHLKPPGEMPKLSKMRNAEVDHRVIDFLNSIDTGVCGYRRNPTLDSDTEHVLRESIPEESTTLVVTSEFEKGNRRQVEELELAHRGKDDKEVYFTLDLESSGTRRMLTILCDVFKAIDKGAPMFVDELELSLHTIASQAVLQLFSSRELNRNGAQLLATTHNTNLIKSDLLRRDQIWFAEKNKHGCTDIYPLTDFQSRKDDNIELGYRQGRYGAVPNDDPVASLLALISK